MSKFSVALILFAVCLAQSCKEGCKDKAAINYDSKATVENGTCMYCTSSFTSNTGTYSFAVSNSPNPSVSSLGFIVTSTNSGVYGNGCQAEGKNTGNKCKNYLSIINLINENVEGSIEVVFTQNDTTEWFYENQQTLLLGPPGSGTDTISFGLVDTLSCPNITSGTLNLPFSNLEFF